MTQKQKAILTRLSISGFKSFAEEVHLDILPGLTGIVGPNGCGKSNIVESLRWVMGESSARALRGGESDDLIFAGTKARPARNLARVSLRLSQTEGLAPAPFQNADELEITRQAERGAGSQYRINQKVMRARDIQTIFADLASGARSFSLISQNRVGQLVNARPEERRLLLEDAAGITGLHVRRHDAELKLKQAEANLERAEEYRQHLEERLKLLEGQTEQARTYRDLSLSLRHHEHILRHLQHEQAISQLEQTEQALNRQKNISTNLEHELQEIKQSLNLLHQSQTEENKVRETARKAMEEKRLALELATNNLQHARTYQAERTAYIEQLTHDLQQQENLLSEAQKTKDELHHRYEKGEEEFRHLTATLPQLEKERDRLGVQLQKQQKEVEQLKASHQKAALQQDSLKARLASLSQHLEHDKTELEKLARTLLQHQQTRKDYLKNKPDDAAIQKSQEHLALLEEQAQKQFSLLQERRLHVERAIHAMRDGEQRLLDGQTRQKNLQQQRYILAKRQKDEHRQEHEQKQLLLSDDILHDLEQGLAATKEHYAIAQKDEKTLRQSYDKAMRLWQIVQSRHKETEQRKILLKEEEKRLHLALQKQKERHEQALKTRIQVEQTQIASGGSNTEILASNEKEQQQYYTALTESGRALEHIRTQHKEAEDAEKRAKILFLNTESLYLRQKGTYEGLAQSLTQTTSQNRAENLTLAETQSYPALLNEITPPPMLLKALGAALTEGLEGVLLPEEETSGDLPAGIKRGWRFLDKTHDIPQTLPPILQGLTPLSAVIEAPPALSRALNAVFMVNTHEEGTALQSALSSGQTLVHHDGTLWRWDGFIRHGDAPSPESVKLEQTQRLRQLEAENHKNFMAYQKAETALLTAQEQSGRTAQALMEAEQKQRQAEAAYHKARQTYEANKQRFTLYLEQLAHAQNDEKTREEEYNLLKERIEKLEKEIAQLPEMTQELQAQHTHLEQTRHNFEAACLALNAAQDALIKQQHQYERQILHHRNAQDRLKDLSSSLSHLVEEATLLDTELHNLAQEREALDLVSLKDAHHDAQTACNEAQALYQTLTLDRQKAVEEHNRLLHDKTRYQQDLMRLEGEEQALQDRLALQQRATEQNIQEKNSIQENLDALPDLSSLTGQYQTETAHLEHLTQHYNALLTDIRTREQARTLLDAQQTALSQQSIQHEKNLVQIQKNKNNLEQRLLDTQQEIRAANHQGNSHQRPEQFEETCRQIREECLHLEKIWQDNQTNLTRLEKEHHELQTRHELQEKQAHKAHDLTIRLNERLKQARHVYEKLFTEAPLDPEFEHNDLKPENLSSNSAQKDVLKDVPKDEQTMRRLIETLKCKRDALGPVNLCAEEEYEQGRKEAQSLETEHHDLEAAISRLRSGIRTINKEGRERLMATFEEINAYFQQLFTRMFGGGTARLQMIGHEDPLLAGLEIFAQPPGKKLASLGLLSGGEQALTALSLIFAAFNCNPAPICVLDEVDAPLDDANIERFCALLTDMTKQTGTRFLVVTHHQNTMAHMDRLFGVTMQERGISRLLSVKLTETLQMARTF